MSPAALVSADAAAAPAAPAAPAAQAGSTAPAPAFSVGRAPTAAPQPGSVELCGVGQVPDPARPDGASVSGAAPLPGARGAQARAAGWPRVLRQLQSTASPVHQAAALMLRIDGFVDAEALAVPAMPEVRATRPGENPWLLLTAQLVALARQAKSAVQADIVRWALQACRRPARAQGCSSLSPRDVLALDPSDGTAVLAQAALRPDQRDALPQAAAAAPGLRFRDWGDALTDMVSAALPQGLPAYLQTDLVVLLAGIDAARPDRSGWELLMHCQQAALDAPGRRALREGVARALVARSDSMAAFGLGTGLARRLDWPREEQARLHSALAAAQASMLSNIDRQRPGSCSSVSRLRDWVQARAQRGDSTASRRALQEAQRVVAGAGPTR